MAIRVDPRRLSLLKELAAAEGLRPGQLVQRWVEERLDAERSGEPVASASGDRLSQIEAAVAALAARVAEIAAAATRAEARAAPEAPAAGAAERPAPPRENAPEASAEAPVRRRGRPRKGAAPAQPQPSGARVALHDEIIAVIREQGPSSAAALAQAIGERGRYRPPRSSRPLDAATVNSRVSNPVYRARFRRSGGRIGLAD